MNTIHRPRTWEELRALPGFYEHAVPKEKMVKGKLVGDYEMHPKSGMQPCGIEQCHKEHRHGYVVELPDGGLSNIGRYCGKRHFGADWARVKSTFSKEKREQAKTAAQRELRARLEIQISDWRPVESDETTWARATLKSFNLLPRELRQALESRAMQGDTSIPIWRDETDEELRRRAFYQKDDKKVARRRVQDERGPLLGLPGIRPDWRVDRILDERIPALLAEARALLERADGASTDELDAISRRLSAIPNEIVSSCRQLRLFVSAENLLRLPLLRPFELAGVSSVSYDSGPPASIQLRRR